MTVETSDRHVSPRVLVVDDNEAAAKTLALFLSIHGYEIREAYGGAQAIRTAEAFFPDVVLLDIGMPILDGFDVAKRMQQTPGVDRAILIAVTGRGGDEWIARTRAAGFRHHLVKTGEPEAVLRLLAQLGLPPIPRTALLPS